MLMQHLPHSCIMSCGYVGCAAQHPTCCLLIFVQAVIFRIYLSSSWIFVLLFGGIYELQFLQIWYPWKEFFWENSLKTTLFYLKTMKHLIRVLVFYRYLIHFSSDFGLWTIILKGKILPTKWSKI